MLQNRVWLFPSAAFQFSEETPYVEDIRHIENRIQEWSLNWTKKTHFWEALVVVSEYIVQNDIQETTNDLT